MDDEGEKQAVIEDWHTAFRQGTDFDLWGQPVEAIETYNRLAECMRYESQPDATFFKDEQKKVLNKLATCLETRGRVLKSPGKLENITLDDMKKVETNFKMVFESSSKIFPIDISTSFHAPEGTESHTIHGHSQSDEEGDLLFKKTHGSLLPPPGTAPGQTLVSIRIEKIGLKDAAQYIDPFVTVLVKNKNGLDLTASQDTPVAIHKEDECAYFGVDIHLQKPLEQMPNGFAVIFEFKHYKPKKNIVSTKCWAFLEKDEIKDGTAVVELYKKPTDLKRKKIHLLTVKPLYLHLKIALNT